MADLTDPSERYQDSYLVALQEFQAEGRHLEIPLEEVAAHFGDFVQHLREQADRAKIKPGRVPHWYFWLIDGNDYIGRLTVAKKYVLVDQSVTRDCYPHKRSMVSWDKAECSVTDLIQPLTNSFPE